MHSVFITHCHCGFPGNKLNRPHGCSVMVTWLLCMFLKDRLPIWGRDSFGLLVNEKILGSLFFTHNWNIVLITLNFLQKILPFVSLDEGERKEVWSYLHERLYLSVLNTVKHNGLLLASIAINLKSGKPVMIYIHDSEINWLYSHVSSASWVTWSFLVTTGRYLLHFLLLKYLYFFQFQEIPAFIKRKANILHRLNSFSFPFF